MPDLFSEKKAKTPLVVNLFLVYSILLRPKL